jgi:outer membrane protein
MTPRRLPFLFLAAAACATLVAPAPAQPAANALGTETGPVLKLDDAIQLALEKNKTLKVTAFERPISQAQLLAARGQFDPSFVLSRIAEQNYADATTTPPPLFETYKTDVYSIGVQGQIPWGGTYTIGGNANNTRYQFGGYTNNFQSTGSFTITQPLLKGFGFNANLANIRIAKAQRSISDYDFRFSAINTVTSVVIAYSNLQLAHDTLDVSERTRSLAKSLLDDNEKSYKIGALSQSEVIVARAQLASLEEPVLVAERQVRDSENALRQLIGEDQFFEDKPLFTLAPTVTPEVSIDRKADLQRALEMRPDYLAARLGIVQRRATEAAAANGLLPQVDFVGGYGYNGLASTFAASRQQVADRLNPSYEAGLQVSIPFTFAAARGTARAARFQRKQAEELLLQMEANIAVQVAAADGQIETTRRRVIADRTAYSLANQALDAEQKKMRAGASTTLQVEQVQQALDKVFYKVPNAPPRAPSAVATYDQVLGTTLERYRIKLADE